MSALRHIKPAATAHPLVLACEENNYTAIRELGWLPALEAARTGWAPRQNCTPRDFTPYAKWLADEDPAAVTDAFRALSGDWRPTPAQVRAHLRRRRAQKATDT